MAAPPWTPRSDGLALAIRLTPKSSRDGIDGTETLADGREVVKVRVRALPEGGAANKALLRLLAKSLRLAGSSLTLETGATARLKTIRIIGDGAELERRLTALIEGGKIARDGAKVIVQPGTGALCPAD